MSTSIDWTPKARSVLAAAGELFYMNGIHAVGVDAIAERAGVTKKTIYDRFGSKSQLVVEYLRDRDRRWREYLGEQLASAGRGPEARLRAVFSASAAWSSAHSGKGCSMINAHAEISDPSHPGYRVIIGQKQWMLELFTTIVTSAGVSSPDSVAEAVLLIHEGALVIDGLHILADPYVRACELAVGLLHDRPAAS